MPGEAVDWHGGRCRAAGEGGGGARESLAHRRGRVARKLALAVRPQVIVAHRQVDAEPAEHRAQPPVSVERVDLVCVAGADVQSVRIRRVRQFSPERRRDDRGEAVLLRDEELLAGKQTYGIQDHAIRTSAHKRHRIAVERPGAGLRRHAPLECDDGCPIRRSVHPSRRCCPLNPRPCTDDPARSPTPAWRHACRRTAWRPAARSPRRRLPRPLPRPAPPRRRFPGCPRTRATRAGSCRTVR